MSTVVAPRKKKSAPHHSNHPADNNPAKDAKEAKKKRDIGPTTEERRRWKNVSMWAIGWLTLAHLVVLAAPFTFTWAGLAVMIGLH